MFTFVHRHGCLIFSSKYRRLISVLCFRQKGLAVCSKSFGPTWLSFEKTGITYIASIFLMATEYRNQAVNSFIGILSYGSLKNAIDVTLKVEFSQMVS